MNARALILVLICNAPVFAQQVGTVPEAQVQHQHEHSIGTSGGPLFPAAGRVRNGLAA